MSLLLFLASLPSLAPTQPSPDLNARTAVWETFVLDHPRWPLRREVAISKTGLALTLEWLSPQRARLTTLHLLPAEVRALFDLVENRVRFRDLKSVCPAKRPRYLLAGRFGYSVPQRMEAAQAVCEDVATDVAPLLSELERLFLLSSKAWEEHEPDSHPPGVVIEATEPLDFLSDLMVTLHANESENDWRR